MKEVDIEVIPQAFTPRPRLPMSLNEKLEQIRPLMDAMAEEAPGPVRHQAAAHALGLEYISTAPGTSIAMNVTCAGVGLSVSGSTIYYITPMATATPQNQPVWKYQDGVLEEQGRLAEPGRMGGLFGWSKDRNLIAGALASYTHNFVAMLALFRDRPKLPQTEPWTLPNMTLAETRAPNQLVLPATYKYMLLRPAARTKYVVELSSETPVKLGFDWWDSGKNNVARIDSLDIGSGDSQVVLAVRTPMSGVFTINPIDAPKGLVIKTAYTIPRSI